MTGNPKVQSLFRQASLHGRMLLGETDFGPWTLDFGLFYSLP